MEAASAVSSLLGRARAERFEQECERLRPLGEAYVLRRFGGSLGRADAEDAVSEVLIRLHRMAAAGRPPQNLRATFFSSVRNQAIDQLRARAIRPTLAIDAADAVPAVGPAPSERAESREDAARLKDALGRMRGNYREAILLRYGLGMTVPEIAAHRGISLPAAKKLVVRATAQARKRMDALEARELCPQMREQARQLVVEKELSGAGEEAELAQLRAHLAHCGTCKAYLATLHERLHDLGAAAVFGITGADHLSGHLSILDGLQHWGGSLIDTAQAGGARARHLAYKATGLLPGSDGATAGALLSSGQKIAAVCTAGATATATCLLSGAVGPGIVPPVAADPPERPPALVREASAPEPASVPVEPLTPAPASVEPDPAPEPKPDPEPPAAPEPSEAVAAPAPSSAPAPPASEEPRPEFGIESAGTSSPAPSVSSTPAPPVAARAPSGSVGGASGNAAPAEAGQSAEPAGAGVGFHG